VRRTLAELGLALLIGAACQAALLAPYIAVAFFLFWTCALPIELLWGLAPLVCLLATGVAGAIIGRRLRRELWYLKLAIASPGTYLGISMMLAAGVEGLINGLPVLILPNAVAAMGWAIGGRGRKEPPEPGFCECGYDLTGNVSGRCPECGAAVRRAARRRENRKVENVLR
jgi:hypothetical protein